MTTDTQTVTVQSLAQEMRSAFETRKRDNGEEYVVLKDGRPDWMQDVCHAAHEDPTLWQKAGPGASLGMLPDDWRYRFIEDAVDALAECMEEEMREADLHLREYVYTHELTGWLHSRNDRYGYCDEAFEEHTTGLDMLALITYGMQAEQREVFDLVLVALEQRVKELSEPARRIQQGKDDVLMEAAEHGRALAEE